MIIKIHIKHLVELDKYFVNETIAVGWLNQFFGHIEGVEKITDLSSKQIKKLKSQVKRFCTTKTPYEPEIVVEFNVNSYKVATDIITYVTEWADNDAAIVTIANNIFK